MTGFIPFLILALVLFDRWRGSKGATSWSHQNIRRGFWVVLLRVTFVLPAWLALPDPVRPWLGVPTLLLLTPNLWLSHVCVRLGWVRMSYWGGRLGLPTGFDDPLRVVGCYYAARALLRRPDPAARTWIETELSRTKHLGGAGVVALGLCAWLRGDAPRGTQLLELADEMPRVFVGRHARRVARDLLVADAAARGDWEAVIERGTARWPLRWSYCVARAAQRITGAPGAPHRATLLALFVLAPRRWTTWPLIRRALSIDPTDAALPPTPPSPTLPVALGRLWSVSSSPVIDGIELRRAVVDVQATLERDEDSAVTLERFEAELVERICGLLETRPVRDIEHDPEGDGILDRALDQFSARRFAELEARAKDYADRTTPERSLDPATEWLAWAEFRRLGDELCQLDPSLDETLFDAIFIPVCNFAVQEQNDLKRRAFAWSVYAWLNRHATDPENQTLLTSNVRSTLR